MYKKLILLLGPIALILSACQSAIPIPQATATNTATLYQSPSSSVKTTVENTATLSPSPIVFPKIDRHLSAANFKRGKPTVLPTYDPNSNDFWQMDLRSYDLATLDLRNSLNDLLFATFDDRTIWPADDKMPEGFDRKQIMELGKTPGLNVQTLHKEGITGKNIGIAIIDQPMLVDHQEYADRVQLYEEAADVKGWLESQMHGPAVASIAVGKTVGVAPEADLY